MKTTISTKPYRPYVVVGHGPGIEEDGFNIEYEEEHCDDVITDRKLLMGP